MTTRYSEFRTLVVTYRPSIAVEDDFFSWRVLENYCHCEDADAWELCDSCWVHSEIHDFEEIDRTLFLEGFLDSEGDLVPPIARPMGPAEVTLRCRVASEGDDASWLELEAGVPIAVQSVPVEATDSTEL